MRVAIVVAAMVVATLAFSPRGDVRRVIQQASEANSALGESGGTPDGNRLEITKPDAGANEESDARVATCEYLKHAFPTCALTLSTGKADKPTHITHQKKELHNTKTVRMAAREKTLLQGLVRANTTIAKMATRERKIIQHLGRANANVKQLKEDLAAMNTTNANLHANLTAMKRLVKTLQSEESEHSLLQAGKVIKWPHEKDALSRLQPTARQIISPVLGKTGATRDFQPGVGEAVHLPRVNPRCMRAPLLQGFLGNQLSYIKDAPSIPVGGRFKVIREETADGPQLYSMQAGRLLRFSPLTNQVVPIVDICNEGFFQSKQAHGNDEEWYTQHVQWGPYPASDKSITPENMLVRVSGVVGAGVTFTTDSHAHVEVYIVASAVIMPQTRGNVRLNSLSAKNTMLAINAKTKSIRVYEPLWPSAEVDRFRDRPEIGSETWSGGNIRIFPMVRGLLAMAATTSRNRNGSIARHVFISVVDHTDKFAWSTVAHHQNKAQGYTKTRMLSATVVDCDCLNDTCQMKCPLQFYFLHATDKITGGIDGGILSLALHRVTEHSLYMYAVKFKYRSGTCDAVKKR